jgi:hypothetical protein
MVHAEGCNIYDLCWTEDSHTAYLKLSHYFLLQNDYSHYTLFSSSLTPRILLCPFITAQEEPVPKILWFEVFLKSPYCFCNTAGCNRIIWCLLCFILSASSWAPCLTRLCGPLGDVNCGSTGELLPQYFSSYHQKAQPTLDIPDWFQTYSVLQGTHYETQLESKLQNTTLCRGKHHQPLQDATAMQDTLGLLQDTDENCHNVSWLHGIPQDIVKYYWTMAMSSSIRKGTTLRACMITSCSVSEITVRHEMHWKAVLVESQNEKS